MDKTLPSPLTAFEEYMLLDGTADHPMEFFFRLRFDGDNHGISGGIRGHEQRIAANIRTNVEKDEAGSKRFGKKGPLGGIKKLRREQNTPLGNIVARLEPHPRPEDHGVDHVLANEAACQSTQGKSHAPSKPSAWHGAASFYQRRTSRRRKPEAKRFGITNQIGTLCLEEPALRGFD